LIIEIGGEEKTVNLNEISKALKRLALTTNDVSG